MKVLIRGSSPDVTIFKYSEYVEVFKEEIHRLRKLGVPKSVTRNKSQDKNQKRKAAGEILREAEEGNYNIGSVSREVVHRANIPVLVVKSK